MGWETIGTLLLNLKDFLKNLGCAHKTDIR